MKEHNIKQNTYTLFIDKNTLRKNPEYINKLPCPSDNICEQLIHNIRHSQND